MQTSAADGARDTLSIRAADGHAWTASVFRGDGAPRAVVICLPALGVQASYYEPLARALGNRGLDVVTSDWRGHGTSELRAGRTCDFGYREIVEEDMPALLDVIESEWPSTRRILLGHSLGGQIGALFAAREPGRVDALAAVASSTTWYGSFRGRMRATIALASVAIPVVAAVIGHYPGERLGFGGREARTLMRDWARNGRTGGYRLTGTDFDYDSALAATELDLLAISIEGDTYATRAAVDHLASKLTSARVARAHITADEAPPESLDHFRWARHPAAVVDRLDGWLSGLERSGTRGER